MPGVPLPVALCSNAGWRAPLRMAVAAGMPDSLSGLACRARPRYRTKRQFKV
jgi:hypothetical protein